jgi:hypothetical protein
MKKTTKTFSRKTTVCKRGNGIAAFGVVNHTDDTNMRGWFINTIATGEGSKD